MKFVNEKVVYKNGQLVKGNDYDLNDRNKTIAMQIINNHKIEKNDDILHLRFDALISHDITYVGIIQSAKASGLKSFPVPYALTNCHNSLCAVGGTINEDDHVFGYSAAKKYGGIYVPANQAVIHQYAREQLAGCGKMILGSDSHTRYGAYGCMGIGEGGPELVKQLLKDSYDINSVDVTLIHVTGKLNKGVGPHDVALVLCKELFGHVKTSVLEFVGQGIANLSNDERIGIDVMTTETGCLSSIWQTDETTKKFYENHQRSEEYKCLKATDGALYDSYLELNLSEIEPMIALPFHPSNAYPIREVNSNPHKYLDPIGLGHCIVDGKIKVDQAIIAGCAGGLYENIEQVNAILKTGDMGNSTLGLNVYPASTPINKAIADNGILSELLEAGAVIKPCFCGPCFGAGDVVNNNGLSIRHTTRNFPNREGSKPAEGQKGFVALMDSRSIAATVANGGYLTAADIIDYTVDLKEYKFTDSIYAKRVYNGFNKPVDYDLIYGPNIADWPVIEPLKDNLLVKLCAVINDEVTTTDELIPSGETSSYRSNPIRLASFTLSRRCPDYVNKCNSISEQEVTKLGYSLENTTYGSAIYANKPGDGSAREQAASCQRVLKGCCNIAKDYATKRYRSNCINWGMIPFTCDNFSANEDEWLYIPGIKKAIEENKEEIIGYIGNREYKLSFKGLNSKDRQIILDGCLMNYNRNQIKE